MSEKIGTPVADPSLTTGNVEPDSLELLHAQMAEAIPMFEAEDEIFNEWVSEYVSKRSTELSKASKVGAVDIASGGTNDFIGPETPMRAGLLLGGRPYYLNDTKAYEASFATVRNWYNGLKSKLPPEQAYLNAVVRGANVGQALYFESIFGDAQKRMLALGDIINDDEPESLSISDYKGAAQCLERAGITHNTLKIFGIDSTLEVGKIEKTDEPGTTLAESHAFLTVVSPTGNKYIFDPTNPVVTWSPDHKKAELKPAMYKLDDPNALTYDATLQEFSRTPEGQVEATKHHEIKYTFTV